MQKQQCCNIGLLFQDLSPISAIYVRLSSVLCSLFNHHHHWQLSDQTLFIIITHRILGGPPGLNFELTVLRLDFVLRPLVQSLDGVVLWMMKKEDKIKTRSNMLNDNKTELA